MKKAFGQTVRELKREVNKKVLKVPGVEQKILDATSNEPWGPHGSLLSDIAQASRNYHEYQIIMHVIWKRLNDTGKNWRHVYKALTVLEYLVGYGSERVIDEIKEHAYQISTLSDFQYIDSIGKDQGNNVRRKSQSLVSLVNDKEKIQEVRQKAAANKDKYLATFSSSGSYRPSSYSSASGYGDRYDDDRYGRYGSRDDDRNDYGREKDLGYRDDDRYARGGGDYYRDGDRYSRDSDEHYGRDSYKEDDYKGGRSNDDYQLGPRNRSFDKDRDHSYEDDDSYSSRNGGTRANDASPDGRQIERKLSEQSVGAPPSYEAAVRNGHTHVHDERDGGVGTAAVPKSLSPAAPEASSLQSTSHGPQHAVPVVHSSALTTDDTSFDEFDPRGFMPASSSSPPPANSALQAASGSGVDLFGNSATMDPANSLALVLATPNTTTNETEVVKTSSYFGMNFVALSSASAALNQPADDPFGDGPFKAIAGENFPIQQQDSNSVVSTAASLPTSASSTAIPEPVAPAVPKVETPFGFDFGDPLGDLAYMPTIANGQQYAAYPNNDAMDTHVGHLNIQTTNTPFGHTSFPVSGLAAVSSQAAEPAASTYSRTASPGFLPHLGPSIPQAAPLPMQSVQPNVQMNMPPAPMNHTQQFTQSSVNQQPSTTVSGPSNAKQSNDKFETKSSVWTDTLNRGLVNLNISGPKTNPLADIGVDFDSINRMDRRKEKEKSSANSITSTVTMGKAMGSGSGISRAGSGSLNPAMGSGMGGGAAGLGMGMGMGGPGGMGSGMGGYGGTMNQPMGLGGPGGGMVMNMGMGMGPGGSMRPPAGMQSPPPGLHGAGYNSMGMGGYGSQQPYGGGYR